MVSRRTRNIAGAVLVAALAGCAGVERQGPPAASDAVVHLDRDSLSLILNLSAQLIATRTDADGHPVPGRLHWRTGDHDIVVVDSLGQVTAVGLGRTWIEVSDNLRADSAIITTSLRFTSIHAGDDVTCALALGGQAVCWGRNTFGTLGDGQHYDRSEPELVDGGRRYNMLSLGSASVCGLANILYCWGYNGAGQLGDGTIAERSRPSPVADTLTLASVFLGAGTTTCAFEQQAGTEQTGPSRTGGSSPVLLCWGWNGFGQMLDGGGVNPHKPKVVDAGRALVTVAPGGHHLCGLDAAGAALCWGRNDEGQLGDSSTADRLAPAAVAGGHHFDMLAAGISHTCARGTTGQVWCWGSNSYGQLGAITSGNAAVPVLAAGGMTFDTIVSTSYHTCGLSAGAAWCWGDNGGRQLGRLLAGSQPGLVAGGLHFYSISAGHNHTCGIATDGFAYCWGDNLHGELGAEMAPDGYSPVKVGGQN